MFRRRKERCELKDLKIGCQTEYEGNRVKDLTTRMPCHVARLSAKTPARLFSRSTRLMVYSGSVNLAERLSREMKHKNGGRRDSFPD